MTMREVEKSALQGDLSQPREWREVGEVQQLYLYPVKSLSCVPVHSFTTGPWAAKSGDMVDRQLIVLNKKGKPAQAEQWPHMTLIEPRLEDGRLTLTYPGMEDITVQLPDALTMKAVKVGGDPCQGLDLGPSVGEWLSEVILGDEEGGMMMLFHPKGESTRPDKGLDAVICPTRKPEDKPYYAHAFPYMMMTQPSIRELNTMLEEEGVDLEVAEKRFRPNILIDGSFPAFSEEKWAWLRVGETVVFRHSQLCPRCEFINIDPDMGDRDQGGEPLKTLKKYRCSQDPEERKVYGACPFIGVNLGVEVAGTVRVGDKVYAGKSGLVG